jgi:serine/threonine protein kinase
MDIVWNILHEIQLLGFSGTFQTPSEFFSWLRKFPLIAQPKPLSLHGTDSYVNGSLRLSEFTPFMSGKFGVVYLVYREKGADAGYIFLKTSPNHPSALLLEGLLQSIAHTILREYGFPKAVPRVLEIVKHPNYGIVLGLERNPGAQLLADYFKSQVQWGSPSIQNDHIVCSVLAQIATYLAILESTIGMNHRDLTGTNVLMVLPGQPIHQTVSVGAFKWTIHASQQAILIDFGFACIGKQDGQMVLSAGELLPQIDFCPKEGRDLFLFCASLWNVPIFRESLTVTGQTLFEKWLQDTSTTNWAKWLATSSQTNLMGMYLLTNAGHFRSSTCDPFQVLADISKAYPALLEFQSV